MSTVKTPVQPVQWILSERCSITHLVAVSQYNTDKSTCKLHRGKKPTQSINHWFTSIKVTSLALSYWFVAVVPPPPPKPDHLGPLIKAEWRMGLGGQLWLLLPQALHIIYISLFLSPPSPSASSITPISIPLSSSIGFRYDFGMSPQMCVGLPVGQSVAVYKMPEMRKKNNIKLKGEVWAHINMIY